MNNNMQLLMAPVYYTLNTVAFHQWCDREEALSDARQAPAAPPAAARPLLQPFEVGVVYVHTHHCKTYWECTKRTKCFVTLRQKKSWELAERRYKIGESMYAEGVEAVEIQNHVYLYPVVADPKDIPACVHAPVTARPLLQPFEVGVVYVCTRPCYSTYWECTKRTKCFVTLRQLEDKCYQLTERRYKIGENSLNEERVQLDHVYYLYPVVADPKDIPTQGEVQQPVYPVFTVGTTYEHITHGGSSHSKYHQQYKCIKRTDFFVWFEGPEDTIRRKIHYYKDDSIYEDGEYVWPLKKEDQGSCPTPLRAVVSIEDLI